MMLVAPLLVFLVHSARSVDYCERDLQCRVGDGMVPHSLCNPQKEKTCLNGKILPITAEMENEILKFHNDVRASLSSKEPPYGLPQACSLRDLVWDTDLEAIATNWAVNQCAQKVDVCPSLKQQGRIIPVGQNIAVVQWSSETPKTPLVVLMGYWWRTMTSMDKNNRGKFITKYEKGLWDPAAQMVWSDSRKIGCAYAQFELEASQGHFVTLVCNYASGGTTPGTFVYDLLQGNCPGGGRKGPEVPVPTIPPYDDKLDLDAYLFDSSGNKIKQDVLKQQKGGSRSRDDPSTTTVAPKGIGSKLGVTLALHCPILLLTINLVL